MSRLSQRLSQLAAADQHRSNDAAVAEQMAHAGDVFELAARCAAGAYKVRPQHPDESDTFRIGYATACKELAIVLRAMRAGELPDPAAMAEARNEAVRESGTQTPQGDDA